MFEEKDVKKKKQLVEKCYKGLLFLTFKCYMIVLQ